MVDEYRKLSPDVAAWTAADNVWDNNDIYAIKIGSPTSDVLQDTPQDRLWRKIVHAGAGLLALAFVATGCGPVSNTGEVTGTDTDIPAAGTAPSGFPVKTITSGVETFSTGKPGDMSISRVEITDAVGTEAVGPDEDNPPGMVRVEVGAGENRWGWVPADENGKPKKGYMPAQ